MKSVRTLSLLLAAAMLTLTPAIPVGAAERPPAHAQRNRPGGNQHKPGNQPGNRPGGNQHKPDNRPGNNPGNRPGGNQHGDRPPQQQHRPPQQQHRPPQHHHRPTPPPPPRPWHRPAPHPHWHPRPGVPAIAPFLGIAFGTALSTALNTLAYNNYAITAYDNSSIVLANVNMYGFLWPQAHMIYNGGLLSGCQLSWISNGYNMSRYSSLYARFCSTYGPPVQTLPLSYNGQQCTWIGGAGGFITLTYEHAGGGRYLTVLDIGPGI